MESLLVLSVVTNGEKNALRLVLIEKNIKLNLMILYSSVFLVMNQGQCTYLR